MAVSDVYQDLYGEGSFTGKGIYDVDAFQLATHGRFPENTLLSHDLIEGNYARAGLVTDVIVYDDYPSTYIGHARRKHRWIRGDWQLLPWLRRRVPGPDGLEPNRLSLVSQWKIIDNLRRSTVELSQMLLLIAGWTVLPGSAIRWTMLGLLAIVAPWAIALAREMVSPPLDKSWRAYYGAVAKDAWVSAQQALLAVVFLPHQALISVDAIARTGYRMLVSHRRLLEWRSAMLVEQRVSNLRAESWGAMRTSVACVIGLAIVAAAVQVRDQLAAGEPLIGLLATGVAMGSLIVPWAAGTAVRDATQSAVAIDPPPVVRPRSRGGHALRERALGASSTVSSPPRRTGSRPTISSRSRSPWWRCAPRRPISAFSSCPRSAPRISACLRSAR